MPHFLTRSGALCQRKPGLIGLACHRSGQHLTSGSFLIATQGGHTAPDLDVITTE